MSWSNNQTSTGSFFSKIDMIWLSLTNKTLTEFDMLFNSASCCFVCCWLSIVVGKLVGVRLVSTRCQSFSFLNIIYSCYMYIVVLSVGAALTKLSYFMKKRSPAKSTTLYLCFNTMLTMYNQPTLMKKWTRFSLYISKQNEQSIQCSSQAEYNLQADVSRADVINEGCKPYH